MKKLTELREHPFYKAHSEKVLWVFLILGTVILVFQGTLAEYFFENSKEPKNLKEIGTLDQPQGRVFYLLPDQFGKKLIKEKSKLYVGSRITTGIGGKVQLKFHRRYVIELLPETKAVVTGTSGETRLDIINGRYRVIKEGIKDSVVVYNRGIKESPRSTPVRLPIIRVERPSKAGQIDEPFGEVAFGEVEATSKPKKKLPTRGKNKDLSDSDITNVMSAQKFWLDKCYASLLKAQPQSSGEVTLIFDIIPGGKVENPKVHKSTIQNKTFQSCVLSTVSRAKFPRFSGDPKKIVFPLDFSVR